MKPQNLIDEAAGWFARLEDPAATAADREAFDAWLLSSPAHIEAYLAVSRAWGDLGLVLGAAPDVEELVREAGVEEDPGKIARLTLPAFRLREKTGGESTSPAFRRYALAATVIVAVVISAVWLSGGHSVLRTQIGEQRSVTLSDGSTVYLNTASEVRIELGDTERRIVLARGEARFSAARDPHRPFIVVTPQATVRAVGTTFNVQANERRTAVTVIEGRVAIGSGEASNTGAVARASALELGAGEHAAVTDRGEILPDTGPSVEQVLAWTQRQLVFRDDPLAKVVAEFNRYRPRAIRIEDARLGATKINGVFDAGDSASLIQYLQRYRDVRVQSLPDGGQLIAPNP